MRAFLTLGLGLVLAGCVADGGGYGGGYHPGYYAGPAYRGPAHYYGPPPRRDWGWNRPDHHRRHEHHRRDDHRPVREAPRPQPQPSLSPRQREEAEAMRRLFQR